MEKEFVAAKYVPRQSLENGKTVWYVVMIEPDGFESAIQRCRNRETCDRASERWNKKETASVNKANVEIRERNAKRASVVDEALSSMPALF